MATRTYIQDGVIRRTKPQEKEVVLPTTSAFYGTSRRLTDETTENPSLEVSSYTFDDNDFSPVDPTEDYNSTDFDTPESLPLTPSKESPRKEPQTSVSFLDCAEDEVSLSCTLIDPDGSNGQDCVVVLYPRGSDPAFSIFDPDLRQRLEFLSKQFHVFLRRVSDLHDAIGIMFSISSVYNIAHLEIGMHGTRDSIRFPNETVTIGSSYTELLQLFTLMDPRGTILSLCCRNGELPSQGNMVEYLATLAEGREVTGLTCDNGKHLELKVTVHPLSIKYTRNGVDVTTRCRI